MTYQIQKLNVASLDFDEIKSSLVDFFKQQPDLSDIDFDNEASTANLLVNILATATAYNGIYAQFGYVNSFATTTTLLNSLLGIAANSSVLVIPVQGASTTRTITAVGATLEEYTTFQSSTPNGAVTFFFNTSSIPAGTAKTTTLYSGSEVISYTNYDYATQSCELPYSIDPRTISLYETTINSGVVNKWTRVEKSATATSGNQNIFTVINGPKGYIVTNNLPNAKYLNTTSTVLIRAVSSNGDEGNNATITQRADVQFNTSSTPIGGYDEISIEQARYSLLFNATGQDRCVTINDFVNAILSSGISGTDDESLITVQTHCCIPGAVKIYVSGLSSTNQTLLLRYLTPKAVAGIQLIYEL